MERDSLPGMNPRTVGMLETIGLEIQVPPTFPEKYRDSVIRSTELCTVRKHLENPPRFEITTKIVAPAGA